MKLAAALIAATIAGTTMASAQSVEFRTGPRHDGVYVERDRDWRDSRAYYRDRGDRDTVVIRKKRYIDRDYDRYDHPRPGVTLRTW